MKRIYCTFLFIFVFSIVLMGCVRYDLTTEESVIQATVTKCEENVHLNYTYEHLAQEHADNYAIHNYYMKLAVENASYTYTISVELDGTTYKFSKSEPVAVGDTIEITKIVTSYEGQLIDTEYK